MKKVRRDIFYKYLRNAKASSPPPNVLWGDGVKDCRKICFGTRTAAKAAARRLRVGGKADTRPGELGAYWCRRCEAYHVGHDKFTVPLPGEDAASSDSGIH
jgi:hypothetical protein